MQSDEPSMTNLLSTKRQSDTRDTDPSDQRLEFDRDFDRILFSAPVRRLADKTQVFPMETNDSVRTRLTHSHEVSNLCRSLSLQIIRHAKGSDPFGPGSGLENVPVIAAAAGLAHDLGNPPFGHQGENALRDWFERRSDKLFQCSENGWALSGPQKLDFLKWEGNAQAFRLVTKLQVSKGNCGLNLTFSTLASLMKYTVASDETVKKQHPAKKKFGYFQDDKPTALAVLSEVGLAPGQRHPIAYVMEACDDIAYSTIDVEDAISKGLVSLNDTLAMLSGLGDSASQSVYRRVKQKIDELNEDGRTIGDVKDIALQYFRSFAIAEMVNAAGATYISSATQILSGSYPGNLVEKSAAGAMCQALKDFALEYAFRSPKVTALELRGANMMHKLMDYLWRGIEEVSLTNLPDSLENKSLLEALASKGPSTTMFGRYAFNRISTNYRANFIRGLLSCSTPADVRYQQLLLLTDMVSGMTEDFVEATFSELRELDDKRGLTANT